MKWLLLATPCDKYDEILRKPDDPRDPRDGYEI